jgi:hypothetical protein
VSQTRIQRFELVITDGDMTGDRVGRTHLA